MLTWLMAASRVSGAGWTITLMLGISPPSAAAPDSTLAGKRKRVLLLQLVPSAVIPHRSYD